mmetsp:Transcript_21057/g.74313  ORF Transcript_21057/g.74313 Transcript_21057/m.74313 type:complete len:246 (+) Transcript_21057:66-803(+)
MAPRCGVRVLARAEAGRSREGRNTACGERRRRPRDDAAPNPTRRHEARTQRPGGNPRPAARRHGRHACRGTSVPATRALRGALAAAVPRRFRGHLSPPRRRRRRPRARHRHRRAARRQRATRRHARRTHVDVTRPPRRSRRTAAAPQPPRTASTTVASVCCLSHVQLRHQPPQTRRSAPPSHHDASLQCMFSAYTPRRRARVALSGARAPCCGEAVATRALIAHDVVHPATTLGADRDRRRSRAR